MPEFKINAFMPFAFPWMTQPALSLFPKKGTRPRAKSGPVSHTLPPRTNIFFLGHLPQDARMMPTTESCLFAREKRKPRKKA
jgi:hypothetical protein